MKTKYRLLTIMLGAMIALPVFSQRLSFETTTLNVGTTLWHKPITGVFRFTNKEREPLVVRDVDAGCGCINVKWTKGEILRGNSGEIVVTYDAKMLGTIDRVINVFTNASQNPTRIRLKGRVSMGEETDVRELYPYTIGNILLSTDNVEFPDVRKGDSTMVSFEIYNAGEEVYTPQLMHLPSYVSAEYTPEMLGRGRRGVVTLTLHGDKMHNIGVNQTNIYLARFPGDKVGDDNVLALTSVLLPPVPQSSLLSSPAFSLSANIIDMGKLGTKKKKTGKVKITNNGRGPLKIETLEVYNQALQVSLPKRTLMPGESTTMKVTLHAKYLGMSKAQPRVLLITNDPNRQKETVTVRYE